MKIRCIAVDDEPPALKVLENFCAKLIGVELLKTFTRPSEALKFLQEERIDLLFLDVRMPALSGIEFYKQAKGEIPVIFTTAHTEYAVDSYNLNAVDYLLKPFTYERFAQAIAKVSEVMKQHKNPEINPRYFLVVKVDYGLVKVNCSDIQYIESQDDYIKIYSDNKKEFTTRMTMKSILEKLPPTDFIRIHRSFIVPLSRIETVRNKMVYIGKAALPISSSYEQAFFSVFKN